MGERRVERRGSARAEIHLELHLERDRGGPIEGRTLDVGSGGMRVSTRRPLRVDELLHFDLEVPEQPRTAHVDGQARVLREHGGNVYALRFEHLSAEAERRIEALAP